ncbi:MAG: hypothetical protein IIB08_05270 [Bacteroidetes bacterium]|nr:hypothetical protein [Bacteroidota bacterium]
MKLSIITFFVLIIFQFALAQTEEDKNTDSLTIVITGLENDDGEVLITVSNSRENYESDNPAFIGMKVKIENRKERKNMKTKQHPIQCGDTELMAWDCGGSSVGYECFLCGRPTSENCKTGINVCVADYIVIKPDETTDSSGFFPVGPECIKKVPKEYRVSGKKV